MAFPSAATYRPINQADASTDSTSKRVAAVAAGFSIGGLVAALLWAVLVGRVYEPRMIYTAFDTYPNSLTEGIAAGTAGALLALGASTLLLAVLGARMSIRVALAGICCIVAAANGAIAGFEGIYAWSSYSGILAFVADSTIGIFGTALGLAVHAHNSLQGVDLSPLGHRNNVFVYDSGFNFDGMTITQGNVISSMKGSENLLAHESLHAWQSRAFGPLYQLVYGAWSVGGLLLGTGASVAGHGGIESNVALLAYDTNPWELWAYSAT